MFNLPVKNLKAFRLAEKSPIHLPSSQDTLCTPLRDAA
jgi:hypothetical protein